MFTKLYTITLILMTLCLWTAQAETDKPFFY